MSDYRDVVAALDFGPASARVLDHAVRATGATGTLHLVHVIEWVPTLLEGTFAAYGHAKEMRLLSDSAKRKLDELAARTGVARTTTHVVQGNAALSILEAAERLRADLLVVGTRGSSRASRLLLGHAMERVLRGAACPVLVVR